MSLGNNDLRKRYVDAALCRHAVFAQVKIGGRHFARESPPTGCISYG
jgi:hypothetical protein